MSSAHALLHRPRARAMRVIVLVLLGALVVPLLMSVFAPAAHADDDERDNYSLYQLASNASSYFGEKNSPDGGGMDPAWEDLTSSPATGGSLLGYADPEFSLGNVVGWFFAEVSGSSQTVTYDTLTRSASDDGSDSYSGMLDYAHFGAANADLGLDNMSSGVGGQIVSAIGGSIMWVLYALALAVGMLFYLIIQLLKLINPFGWFYLAVSQTADSSGSTTSTHQQELADGMTGGGGGGSFLPSLQSWISEWYTLIQSIAWEALVPLFIAFTIIGIILFKRMDRGSAIKKLIVRLVFIGVGLPLVGSMYTGVLDKFDDSLVGQHAGPTRVVLSTYVDFEAWAMNDRLAVPADATIGWEKGQSSSEAMMSVRRSALAINVASHGDTYADIDTSNKLDGAEDAWRDGTTGVDHTAIDDANAVFTTFGVLNRYISSASLAASDFESGIKGAITKLDADEDLKKDWFVGDDYGDVIGFGEGDSPEVAQHPVISTSDQTGLTSSNPGGRTTTFTTSGGTRVGCGLTVADSEGNPRNCNLAPLAMYNYLNTGFDAESLTMYSSNNATSGFTRESHSAVSQVGTGPAKFMYWHNAATVLGGIVILGIWYAIGMLVGSVKRTFSLVTAVPFATLGSMAAIAKVITYTAALILEVIVTLFIYQFVSQFLISIPDIIAGPVSSLMSPDGLFGSPALGGIVVVILTLVSSLLIMGVTFALLKVRKIVLKAMDEVFTKLVDKFLETNGAAQAGPRSGPGGVMPALASGVGPGAGMAAGNKLASGVGGRLGGGAKSPSGAGSRGNALGMSTNAGGLNADPKQLGGGGSLALDAGERPGGGGDDPDGPDGGSGDGGHTRTSGGSTRAIESARSDGPRDKGGPLQLGGSPAGSSQSDKQTAQALSARGGLSNLGIDSGPANGKSQASGSTSGGPGFPTNLGMGAPAGELTKGQGASGQSGQKGGSGEGGPIGRARSGSGRDGADGVGSATPTNGSSNGLAGSALSGQSTPTQFGFGGAGRAQNTQPGQPASLSQGPRFTVGPDGAPAIIGGAVSGVQPRSGSSVRGGQPRGGSNAGPSTDQTLQRGSGTRSPRGQAPQQRGQTPVQGRPSGQGVSRRTASSQPPAPQRRAQVPEHGRGGVPPRTGGGASAPRQAPPVVNAQRRNVPAPQASSKAPTQGRPVAQPRTGGAQAASRRAAPAQAPRTSPRQQKSQPGRGNVQQPRATQGQQPSAPSQPRQQTPTPRVESSENQPRAVNSRRMTQPRVSPRPDRTTSREAGRRVESDGKNTKSEKKEK